MSTTRISLVLNVLLAVVCVVLLQQNRALKLAFAHPPATLKPGIRVVPFAYHTLGGQSGTLAFHPQQRCLLFVISTTCPWCERSLPQIQSISRAVAGPGVRPLAVSIHDLDATATFAANEHIGFTLVSAAASDDFQRAYEIDGVPTTILLDGTGTVMGVWEGAITPQLAHEIQAAAQHS